MVSKQLEPVDIGVFKNIVGIYTSFVNVEPYALNHKISHCILSGRYCMNSTTLK